MARICACALFLVGFGLLAGQAASEERQSPGYGPWRLGMSRADVENVSEFGPYKPVPSTGGLETPNGRFEDFTTTISFTFKDSELSRITVWAYEGTNLDEAIVGAHRVYTYLRRNFGELKGTNLPLSDNMTVEGLSNSVKGSFMLFRDDQVAKLQMAPRVMPGGYTVFSSFFRHPGHGYYVFMYIEANP